MGVHWKIWLLSRGSQKTNIDGEDCLKKGTWIVSWFKGRLGKKEGAGGFKVGGLRTQCTLCITWQNNSFLLELIDHILLISEYVLEKTLVAFDLDEKLTQTIAQIK